MRDITRSGDSNDIVGPLNALAVLASIRRHAISTLVIFHFDVPGRSSLEVPQVPFSTALRKRYHAR